MIDWQRDNNGKPKRMKNGSYVLKKDGICFAIKPKSIGKVIFLMDELLAHLPTKTSTMGD